MLRAVCPRLLEGAPLLVCLSWCGSAADRVPARLRYCRDRVRAAAVLASVRCFRWSGLLPPASAGRCARFGSSWLASGLLRVFLPRLPVLLLWLEGVPRRSDCFGAFPPRLGCRPRWGGCCWKMFPAASAGRCAAAPAPGRGCRGSAPAEIRRCLCLRACLVCGSAPAGVRSPPLLRSSLAGAVAAACSALVGAVISVCSCCGCVAASAAGAAVAFASGVCRAVSLVVASCQLDALRLCSCRGSAGITSAAAALRWAEPAPAVADLGGFGQIYKFALSNKTHIRRYFSRFFGVPAGGGFTSRAPARRATVARGVPSLSSSNFRQISA